MAGVSHVVPAWLRRWREGLNNWEQSPTQAANRPGPRGFKSHSQNARGLCDKPISKVFCQGEGDGGQGARGQRLAYSALNFFFLGKITSATVALAKQAGNGGNQSSLEETLRQRERQRIQD